jgi:hypothetical protein
MKWLPNKNAVATLCFRNKFDVGLSSLSNNMRNNHGTCNAYIKYRLRGSFRKCRAIQSVRQIFHSNREMYLTYKDESGSVTPWILPLRLEMEVSS